MGLVVVGPLVPAIIDRGGADGWRAVWCCFAVIAACVAAVGGFVLRNRPRDAAEPSARDNGVVFREFGAVARSRFAWHLGSVYFLYGFGSITFVTFFQRRLTGDLGLSGETAATSSSPRASPAWRSVWRMASLPIALDEERPFRLR